ncbi:ATP-binding cassette subfamily B protein [Paenibacillus cellulosilyticus]|uniref:ATP-binding cassette subfamily B protein n=1 Tax=Paenibacillus cellulosilyticus TaxID=375489 RepID=A0A2V2YW65_9BACL|nr:ABC transporter ATP-binding protein [Paenibacillus cellulosilyticus]PWW05601.1 ATP-binding cassette subfamily B protein [Paenibacillus cellulosilyticus]QKS45367.1 ABC transporter ATP-binding protein [Paenibacillus cellulosilyticus]
MEVAKGTIFRRLISYTKRYRLLYVGLLISMLVGIGLELSVAQYLSRMTNVAASGDQSQWSILIVAGATILVLTVLFQYGDAFLKGIVSSRIRRDLRDDTMDVVLRLTQSEFDRSHSGELTARLTNDNAAIGDLFGNTLLQLIRNPLLAIAAFIFLLQIYWPLAIICFLIGPTTLLIGILFGKPIMNNSIQQQQRQERQLTFLQDILNTSLLFKAFGLESKLLHKFRSLSSEVTETERKGAHLQAAIAGTGSGIGLTSFIVAFVFGAYFVTQGKMGVGGLLAFIQLLNHLTWPFTNLAGTWGAAQQSFGAANRIFELIDREVEQRTFVHVDPSSERKAVFEKLEVENVQFDYSHSFDEDALQSSVLNPAVNNISFTIIKGQRVGVVGPSGSGKTSLFKLLLGLYRVQSGVIKLNGASQETMELSLLRSYYSLVPQESRLYTGTIRDNLLYGKADASEEEMLDALQAANALDFVMRLPDGLDSELAEHGGSLSGGQRQRIAIARAMLRDAPILLLDEATSALDSESERDIVQALNRLSEGKTTITIAHRLYMVRDADVIIVMDQGQIQAIGKHEELLVECDLYRRMFDAQMYAQDHQPAITAIV